MGGDEVIPTLVPTHSVKDFGAVGDGQADDTRAFASAIAAVPEGSVLAIPEGRCVSATERRPIGGCWGTLGHGGDGL